LNLPGFELHRRRLLAVAIAIGLAVGLPAGAATTDPAPGDMSLGNPHARVTVIEYGSASCTHCAHFNNDIFPAFKAKYIDTGRVHYMFREFLTEPVNLAAASFLLARCGAKDQYFTILDAVFRAQAEIYQTGDASGILHRIAKQAGLSARQADACITDKAAQDALNARVNRFIRQDDIHATPTFFVNGDRLEGVQTVEELGAAIDHAEARRR
jgi:protein-disulfide isomerase